MGVRRALVSVSDKRDVLDFARGLKELGVEILSTGGTAETLRKGGVAVTDVSSVTGFPEMMDGRVKTLHPRIHGALLGLRDNPEHRAAMEEHGIEPIDLVVVNLYPFARTVARADVSLEEAIENIDIGGPSMIRSAAKNHASVGVVVDPDDYPKVLQELQENLGSLTFDTRCLLAAKAFAHTAAYDATIQEYLGKKFSDSQFPQVMGFYADKVQDLRYGENPHQKAAFYRETGLNASGCIAAAKQIHGKELSFNNILDLNAALELVKEFEEPAAVIIKHTNPCGCALGSTLQEAFLKAWEADPISRFGGIIAVNRVLDAETAEHIVVPGSFYEAIVAPEFHQNARSLIEERKGWGANIRILECGPVQPPHLTPPYLDFKRVVGGLLVQEADRGQLDLSELKVVTRRQPTDQEKDDLLFAWKVIKHVKSNAIVFAKGRALLGAGTGQMNRLESVALAAKQAGEKAKGAVLPAMHSSPMPDGPTAAATAGVTAIIQPGGSVKDDEVIQVADQNGLAMIFTGMRHFRH